MVQQSVLIIDFNSSARGTPAVQYGSATIISPCIAGIKSPLTIILGAYLLKSEPHPSAKLEVLLQYVLNTLP